MPNHWTIAANGVQGGQNKSQLVGCHFRVTANGTCYVFESPNGTSISTTCEETLPTPPFQFPMFRSALGGRLAMNWYITVETVTGGPSQNQARGKWSNTGFANATADPADTWVAQAGVGVDPEEEASGASA